MVRLALLRLLESYFRHRWLYFLPIVITVAAAGVYAALAVPKYISGGILYVQNQSLVTSLNDLPQTSGGSWWVTPAEATRIDISDLLQTEAFVRSLIQGTSLEAEMNSSPEAANEVMTIVNTSVSVVSVGNNMVRFGIIDQDPQLSFQLAKRLPESYVLWKLNSSRKDSIAAQKFFTDLLQPYQQQQDTARAALQRYLEDNPAPIRGDRPETESLEIERLKAEVDKAETRVLDVRAKEESAQLSQTQAESNMRQNYIVVDAPQEPNRPLNGLRARLMSGSIFIVIGVVLCVVAVIGGAVLDRSLRFPIDAYQWLHLPVLAMPPQNRRRRKAKVVSSDRRSTSRSEGSLTIASATSVQHEVSDAQAT